MKKFILISLTLFLLFEFGNAQCKFKNSIPKTNQYAKSDSRPEIELASKLTRLKLQVNGYAYSFCKSTGDSIYLYLAIGSNWERFEIHKTNPVIIKFDDETKMTIYPNGDYKGKIAGMGGFQIAAYYNLNVEQLAIFSNKLITNVQINFSDDEKKNANTWWNDDGTVYYNLDIINTEKAAEFKETAHCLLNHK